MNSPDNRATCVLVTGAAGYIGSHTVLTLARSGHEVIAVDDFSNSSRLLPQRLAALSPMPIRWMELDIRDAVALDATIGKTRPAAVIHFAGLKSVGQSCADPLAYYDVNVAGTLQLLDAIARHRIPRLIFSSSATVYDPTQPSPVPESGVLSCVSPYGRSKWMAERMIADFAHASGALQYAILRYFNPVGADASGEIGESPMGTPANLMPMVCRVASGKLDALTVFGDDYPTRDGTGVRDYVHVEDVARAHVMALECLCRDPSSFTINIGTGTGCSVIELLEAFARATGITVPYRVAARRAGDIAELYADATHALQRLGWRAELDLDRMCRDAWRWQTRNPGGYGG